MARYKFRRNSVDLRDILKSQPFAEMVERATRQIAEHAQATVGENVEVDTMMVSSDRAHGIVAIKDPRGLGIEGRTGALSKGAASLGLPVKAKKKP